MGDQRLRAMQEGDLDRVLAWRNHPDIRKFMYSQHEIGREEHRAWFEKAVSDPARHLLIFESDTEPSGFVSIAQHCEPRIADWGFYLAPDARSGSGKQLGDCALEYAFSHIGLHKLCGEALIYNERSISFHERLGFHREGVLRDQHFDGKKFHAVIKFGLLRSEWQSFESEEVKCEQ